MKSFLRCFWSHLLTSWAVGFYVFLTMVLMVSVPVMELMVGLQILLLGFFCFCSRFVLSKMSKLTLSTVMEQKPQYGIGFVLVHGFDFYLLYGLLRLQSVIHHTVDATVTSAFVAANIGEQFSFLGGLMSKYIISIFGASIKLPLILFAYGIFLLGLCLFLEFLRMNRLEKVSAVSQNSI